MALLHGRRRLGKTYLLRRFLTTGGFEPSGFRPHCYLLADQTTAFEQRNAFAAQLLAALPDRGIKPDEIAVSWNALLRAVSSLAPPEERFGLILDEFPYLVEQTPELPSILQAWWDREGVHSRLFVILCGSQLSVMSDLGAATAPLYGRFNAGIIILPPFRYDEVAQFYAESRHYGVREILTIYGILGGSPRYHALVDPGRPMDEEIVSLLFRPGAPLENEVRFLLGSEQIRDPAPYNAVLRAIARGSTRFGEILGKTGTERSSLSFYLRTLSDLGWIRREIPFGETSDRRALYRIDDPFLAFWHRMASPIAGELQLGDPREIYRRRIEPHLSEYMDRYVFEEICAQWLRRHAGDRLGVTLRRMGRYWSRDGRIEIDVAAERDDGRFLFGECKWSVERPVGLGVLADLRAKVAGLPDPRWRDRPFFLLFSAGGFAPEMETLAADPEQRITLIGGRDLLPGFPSQPG